MSSFDIQLKCARFIQYTLLTLTKNISWECKYRFDGRKCSSDQWLNKRKWRYECKKCHVCEKDYIWNHSRCSCEKLKYLASIMDDSAIICDEVIE